MALVAGVLTLALTTAAVAAASNGRGHARGGAAIGERTGTTTTMMAEEHAQGVGPTVSQAVYSAHQQGLTGPALADAVHDAIQSAFGPGSHRGRGLTVAESVYESTYGEAEGSS